MNIRVNYILPRSKANGPGTRFTIWVQGCSIRCPGCSNVDTWDPAGGRDIDVQDILKQINTTSGLDGITITGGEPFDQFEPVCELCQSVPKNLSVFITTGYKTPELIQKNFFKIWGYVDILCVGPFEKDKICSGEWRGSSNQEIFYMTALGKEQSVMPVIPKEVIIAPNGDSLQTGFTV